MKLNIFQVVVMAAGATLLYSGIKNVNPIEVLKSALTNQPVPQSTSTGNLNPNVANGGTNVQSTSGNFNPNVANGLKNEGGLTKGRPVANVKYLSV